MLATVQWTSIIAMSGIKLAAFILEDVLDVQNVYPVFMLDVLNV